jgi:hypothetical protein
METNKNIFENLETQLNYLMTAFLEIMKENLNLTNYDSSFFHVSNNKIIIDPNFFFNERFRQKESSSTKNY